MQQAVLHGVYGAPPADLASVPGGAIQFSPLVPGADELEAHAADLSTLTLLAPPGTLERRYALAVGLLALKPQGRLVALAPKDKGGARLVAELAAFGLEVAETSKRHHRICHAVRTEHLTGIREAIAAGAPAFVETLGLWSQPGVFAHERIDPGSALLLAHLPPLVGQGADLGCGIGVLSRAILASGRVSALTLIDLDRRAIAAARRNVADPRARFVWADIRTGEGMPAALDFVVTNPPFHDGGAEDRALGRAFIEQAAAHLRKGGVLWLVANRHLPYEETLRRCFSRIRLVVEEAGYKVYEAAT